MDVARCSLCETLSVLECMARLEYEDPGTTSEWGVRERADASLHLCPRCARKATRHLKRMFGRRWLRVEKIRAEAA
ncbi:MAG: hypothetical protein M0R75_14685 [Dehalococcoidia bacterium]|nr:hypothetical protein [Dehalococcoidia bacterium]